MANWIDALKAALGGAGGGAGIGNAVVPGVGAAVGAAGGGILGFLTSLLSGGGKEGGVEQVPIISPEQASVLQFLLQQGHEGLQNPYSGFEPIAQQARSQFSQQTVPSLAERFASMGQNSTSSPAFAAQLGQAGAGLSENLAAMQSQYGQQNRQNALQQLALGLSPSFQNIYQQHQPGFGENLLQGAAQAAPSFYQSFLLNKKLQS
jgi:hypothetical protein